MSYILENIQEFQRCNITRWHELGYTGQGIKLVEIESSPILPMFDGKLHDPFNYASSQLNIHGQKVLDIMHQVAPGAELYELPSNISNINGVITGAFLDKTLPFINSNAPFIVGASVNGFNYPTVNELIRESQGNGNIFVCSAGNDDAEGLTAFAESDVWLSVGAVGINADGSIYPKNYSSEGAQLDLVGFSGLYVHDATTPGRTFPVEGTSFSQPFISGMLALVQQFFLERAGRTLNQTEMLTFIQDYTMDLGIEGLDTQYGNGLLILPEPDSIDVDRYIGGDNMVITLQIGNTTAYVDGQPVTLLTPPIIQNNTTLVPIRFIAEAFGCQVDWHQDTQTVVITK